MKTSFILLAALLFVGVTNTNAEKKETKKETATALTTSISGTITDAATGENLVGVKVVLEELNTIVYTDFDGNFEFANVTNGNYTVSTDYVSYKNNKSIVIDTNKASELAIKLEADE